MDKDKKPMPGLEVHFIELKTDTWEVPGCFKVFVRISEFLYPPSFNFYLKDKNGVIVSELTFVESSDSEFVFTMHIRRSDYSPPLELTGEIFYPDDPGVIETKSIILNG